MSEQMRDCESVAPYLSPFADGELAEPLHADVASHLSVCDVCAAQVERIRAIGVTDLLGIFDFGGLSTREAKASMGAFARAMRLSSKP